MLALEAEGKGRSFRKKKCSMDKYTIIFPQKMSTKSYTRSASCISLALFWQQSEDSIKMLTSTHDTLANPKHHEGPHSSCSLISKSGFKTRSAAATRTKLSLESRGRTRTKLSVGSRSRSEKARALEKTNVVWTSIP